MTPTARHLTAAASIALLLGALVLGGIWLLAHPLVTHHLGTVAATVGSLAGWAFVIAYYQGRWRQYEEGVHVMLFTIGITMILSYVAVVNLANSGAVREPETELIRLLIFGFVAVMMIDRYRLLRKVRRRDREAELTLERSAALD